jgi:TonB family protein
MRSRRSLPLFALALLSACGAFVAQAQTESQSAKQDNSGQPATPLKLIHSPTVPYPEEALRKNVEGKVTLSIVVNATGRVSDAKVLSGPPELVEAAIQSVKQWEFEPPAHPPAASTAEISYGYPRECPGPVSDAGEVEAGGWFTSKKGTVIGWDDAADQSLPTYFTKDRKAGVAGTMVLGITVNAQGKANEVHVVKSLSPHLDKAAVKTVRAWRFRLVKGSPDSLPDDFEVPIRYLATCAPQF